jgi:hypothetical protein
VAGRLAGADECPDLLAPAKQLTDQRGANLAAAPDDKNHRPSPFAACDRLVSGCGGCLLPTCSNEAGLIKGQSLIGLIRISD